MKAIERDVERTRRLFDRVERVREVARRLQVERPRDAAELLGVCRDALADAAPVSIEVAADLMSVSDTTVRTWTRDGLLTPKPRVGGQGLDAARLHSVLCLLDDLREQGRSSDVREALWQRLEDDALLNRQDLAESMAQLRAGDLSPARTRAEQAADTARP